MFTLSQIVDWSNVAAIAVIVQFLLGWLDPAAREQMNNYAKIGLSILVGVVIPPLTAYYLYTKNGAPMPNSSNMWFFLILQGIIEGAIATGSVSLGFKVVKNVRTFVSTNASGTYSTTGTHAGKMLE